MIERPTEEEACLVAILQDHSGLDQAEFMWVDRSDMETGADACWRAWPFQYRWWRCKDPKQIEQGARCLAEGTPVMYRTGPTEPWQWSPIEDIEPGAWVLTHTGNSKQVIAVHDNGVEPTVSVSLFNGIRIRCTPTHKFYTKDGAEVGWKDPLNWDRHTKVRVYINGEWSWENVRTIAETPDSCRVYDLEVEDDHSYVASGIVVHNSIGKSLGIKARATAFPFCYPGQEMVLTAPENKHLLTITDSIETAYSSSKILSSMLKSGVQGITHRPFKMNFKNGARILGATPNTDGSGVKGLHPIVLEQDEASDYPHRGWIELIETVKQTSGRSEWRAHGVTRGVQDRFWSYTQPDSGWKVHHISAIHRPTWTDEERQSKIRDYGGGASDPEYLRNVMGLHGNAVNPIFIKSRLAECFNFDMDSKHNKDEYQHYTITSEMIEDAGGIDLFLDLPYSHKKYKNVWIGMDVGYTEDPTEILCFAEVLKAGKVTLKLVSRFSLQRNTVNDQSTAMMYLLDFYDTKAFGMDGTGNGLPLYQSVIHTASTDPYYRAQGYQHMIQSYNFSQKIMIGYKDTALEVESENPLADDLKDVEYDEEIFRPVLEYSTDVLRYLVDNTLLQMPGDNDVYNHFQAQTYMIRKAKTDEYGRSRKFSSGSYHTLDAARMAALAWRQAKIAEIEEARRRGKEHAFVPVLSRMTTQF